MLEYKKPPKNEGLNLENEVARLRAALEQKGNENSQIFSLLEEGIFLLNEQFSVHSILNPAVKKIFENDTLEGINFLELLENHIPAKLINDTREYLNLLFKADLDEQILDELNRLEQVEFYFNDAMGVWKSSKYLSFRFKRLFKGKNISYVVGIVQDISCIKHLEKKVNQAEKESRKQMEWMINILHIKPQLLQEFINVTDDEIKKIDQTLRDPSNTEDPAFVLTKVRKSIKNVRNNAAFLDLQFFEEKAKIFQEKINGLNEKESITGSDFVPIVLQLGELKKTLQDIKELIKRLNYLKSTLRTTRRYEASLIIRALSDVVTNLSHDYDKRIRFIYKKFNSNHIPYQRISIIKEFLFTLTSYTIAHVIEKPEERRAINLDPVATIEVETTPPTKKNVFEFKFRHDGRVIRMERLLEKIMDETLNHHKMGSYDKASRPGTEIMRLFFLSDSDYVEREEQIHADKILHDFHIAHKKLKKKGGRIKITFTTERYIEYTISIPKR